MAGNGEIVASWETGRGSRGNGNMKNRTWAQAAGAATLGMVLSGLTGCQTWVGGLTLPSGRYLEHQPQFFPPSPSFPLSRELATQEEQSARAAAAAAPAAPVPPPIVPAPIAPPQQVPPPPQPAPGGVEK
jgi:hypothetical protein